MDIIDSTLADFAENDLKELWDSDYYADSLKAAPGMHWTYKEALKVAGDVDWTGVLEGGGGGGTGGGGGSGGSGSGEGGATGVVLNDRLMTEASLGVISQLSTLGGFGGFSSLLATHSPLEQHSHSAAAATDKGVDSTTSSTAATDATSPVVKVEHSYSLASDSSHPHSPLSDLESECFPAIPISEAEGGAGGGGVTTTTTTTTTTTATTTRFTTIITDRSSATSSSTTTTTASAPISITTTTSTSSAALRKANSTGASSASSSCSSQSPSPECGTYDIISSHPNLGHNALLAMPSLKTSLGLVRPSAVVVTQRSGSGVVHSSTSRIGLSSLTLRLPSSTSTATTSSSSPTSSSSSSSSDTGFYLPPTPPSCSSSDSECGSQSPTRTPPLYEALTPQFCNPRKVASRTSVSTRNPINTPLISTQPKGATGAINLTEEEKRTLLSEGYNIPSRLPLTKAEEKSLKKIRRKIKNKISAQESRRKKKDYMDALERKVEKLSSENMEYKRRIELLQTSNSQLLLELQQLQCLVEQDEKYRLRSSSIATLLS